MTNRITALFVLTCSFILSLSATASGEARSIVALSPAEAAQAREAILRWLECEECRSGELKAVTRLGPVATPSLIASLYQGPSQAKKEMMRRHLIRAYNSLDPTYKMASETDYIEHYQGKYFASYQVRAAKALACIGGEEATRGLKDVLQTPLDRGVAKAVENALMQLNKRATGNETPFCRDPRRTQEAPNQRRRP